jgi:hypothetical protein
MDCYEEKIMSDLKEKVRAMSVKLSDNMGYIASGGIQWGARALKDIGKDINFDKVYGYIKAEKRRSKLLAIMSECGPGVIFAVTSQPNPMEILEEEYGLDEIDSTILVDECRKALQEARIGKDCVADMVTDGISTMKISSMTTVFGRQVDEEIINFAKMYNDGRIPYKDSNVIPPDQMEDICNKVDMMMSFATNAEERECVAGDILRILHDKYGKRYLRASHKTIMLHECAKTMLKYGVVPSEGYREWGDQAIALACMWRKKRTSVKWAINKIASTLFDLSHYDEHPEGKSEEIVTQLDEPFAALDSAELPIGISVKHAFLNMKYHDEKYLFWILAKISEKCGRKKPSSRRKRRK